MKGIGHGHPSMSLALAEAAGRYGHVMFPSNLHPPAVQLAQYLLEKGPGQGWADRVFYSGIVLVDMYWFSSALYRTLCPSCHTPIHLAAFSVAKIAATHILHS